MDSLKKTGNSTSGVFYAGDSITDVEALTLVRENGGLALSFNGNSYAIKAAEWAAISGNTALIGAVAHLVTMYGTRCLERLPIESDGRCEGANLIKWLKKRGVAQTMFSLLEDSQDIPLAIIKVDTANVDTIIKESEHVRKEVRGISIGKLG
jgi:energy-converting hydrogenase A subunit R